LLHKTPSLTALFLLVLTTLQSALAEGMMLFDAHLHYNADDKAQFEPEAIIDLLGENRVEHAVITSRPPQLALQLHEKAPERIVPILGVYRSSLDKPTWMHNPKLPSLVQQALADRRWRGIGELHLFALDRRSPVFLRIVELAQTHELPLLLHCDPAVIDAVFEHAPGATVIWAHAGAYPFVPLLRDYLERYPGLHIDLSVRDERIAPGGELDPEWEWILSEFADRFLVGVDTYRTRRWENYPQVAAKIRKWLQQLPESAANAIARDNGRRLFNTD